MNPLISLLKFNQNHDPHGKFTSGGSGGGGEPGSGNVGLGDAESAAADAIGDIAGPSQGSYPEKGKDGILPSEFVYPKNMTGYYKEVNPDQVTLGGKFPGGEKGVDQFLDQCKECGYKVTEHSSNRNEETWKLEGPDGRLAYASTSNPVHNETDKDFAITFMRGKAKKEAQVLEHQRELRTKAGGWGAVRGVLKATA